MEGGVDHAERLEDARPVEIRGPHAGPALDQRRLHVHRHRVQPFRARLVGERQGRDLVGEFGQALRLPDVGGLVELVERVGLVEAVAEAGGVGHQLAHGRRLFHRDRLRLARIVQPGEHAGFPEHWQVLVDPVVGTPVALVVSDAHRNARHRLGHREDAEDGVEPERLAGVEVLLARHVRVHGLAPPRDQRHHTRQRPIVDQALEVGVNLPQARRGKSHGLRRVGDEVLDDERIGHGGAPIGLVPRTISRASAGSPVPRPDRPHIPASTPPRSSARP